MKNRAEAQYQLCPERHPALSQMKLGGLRRYGYHKLMACEIFDLWQYCSMKPNKAMTQSNAYFDTFLTGADICQREATSHYAGGKIRAI
ncbi:hypothetical protein [Pseudoalteromonas sp. R3]|uniref:hypothetical protein n=1 Tax=Pseudoalteromonas sp. R3 TaxID=1709477 RepID=UPI000FDE7F1B|nr:hypothetical protein [Pseudoalteromonas sp. R3]AZZ97610.1 hypothetical protein ELR70_11055 [Pseudoalteromonas sp. R3]